MSDDRQRTLDPNRRSVLKAAGAAGVFAALPWATKPVTGETGGDVTDHKWEDPLPRPGVLTPESRNGGTDSYEIELTEFEQTVLPESMGKTTTLWGYEGTYPAATIEARPGRPVEVEYVNNLPGDHLLSVDRRIHGADHGAPAVRTVTHLHGGVVAPEDDGYPEAWVTPDGETAADIDSVPDSEVDYKNPKAYPNDQKPGTLWYHDHALGITRLNVYAGLAGFYLLRDPMENALPNGQYEIPILFQDRTFTDDGSLFYPQGDEDDYEAEFAGDIPVVNGKAYPYLEVEPRTYRFRLLNGSNNRTFNLRFFNEDTGSYEDVPLMQQIGVDLGFLDEVVEVGPGGTVGPEGPIDSMLLSGAERADVIVDFSGYEGTTFTVKNNAEFPYAGEDSGPDVDTIGEMLQVRVTDSTSSQGPNVNLDGFLKGINRKHQEPQTEPSGVDRTFTLDSAVFTVEGGEFTGDELDSHFLDLSLWADDAAIVTPTLDTSEVWRLINTTGDSHPIHLHLVDFEVLERESFEWVDGTEDGESYQEAAQAFISGEGQRPDIEEFIELQNDETAPNPNNQLHKDTVLVNPREVVRIRPDFTGFTGLYPWHCHILEHEDQEMMLPYEVRPAE